MKRFTIVLFVFLFFASLLSASNLRTKNVDQKNNAPAFLGYNKSSFVIKFDKALTSKILQAKSSNKRLTGIKSLDDLNKYAGVVSITQRYPNSKPVTYKGRVIDPGLWFKVEINKDVNIEDLARRYRALAGVLDAQPSGIHKIYATSNDPQVGDQWHLDQPNDHDIDAKEAWDVETGNEDIIVAVLDTGVRYYHKDLGGANASPSSPENSAGNMWVNEAEKNGIAGVDDDNNGFVDDWIGWDFVDNQTGWSGEDADTPDNDPRDFNGHGTHCSGIIAAINNNGYGVSSPAGGWLNGSQEVEGNGVKVMAMRIGYSGRFFIFEVGYVDMAHAADAFMYAADNGARIASCSWGSSNSGGLGDAIDYFIAKGGMVFKAAGNDNDEGSDYMLDRSDVIGVASTDQNDVKSDFSTYGTFVDISAPGSDIVSTYHDHDNPNDDVIASLSGTSMATPLTASVAALIWSQNPGWDADQVKQKLYDTTDDIYGIAGNANYAGKLGVGRVNAFNAVDGGGGGPLPPTANFTASNTSGCAPLEVSFTQTATGDVSSYSWDFGDGANSSDANPVHSYNSPGNYTVSLTVTGPGGSDTETKTNFVSVTDGAITAEFTSSTQNGEVPLSVDFTDNSSGDVTTWSWDFGDGGSSTSQNPSHTYSNAGTYSVSLTASNACGTDTETKTNYITVTEPSCDAPVAAFSSNIQSGDAPLNVSFTDNSSNSPTEWSWDFGDGGSSTAQNPSHTYNSAGTYSVTLTATNSCGSDNETKVNYITVTDPPVGDAMHVDDIAMVKQAFFIITRGSATVKIVDQNGQAVSGASIEGQWSGSSSKNVSGTTNSNGEFVTTSNWVFGNGTFQFCVTDVSKSGYTYDENDNVMTCNSTDGSSSNDTPVAAKQVNNVKVEDIESDLGFKLAANSPNPFNPSTTITYVVPENAHVKLEIYNVLGQRVRTLVNEVQDGGVQSAFWNGADATGAIVSSGFYIYQITVDNKHKIRKKMLMLK